MKFRSPTDEPLHIALTTGHTAVVSADGTELAPMFHREAVARGAFPVDSSAAGVDLQTQMLARHLAIKEALDAMLNGADKDDFTADGKPNLTRLKSKAGFAATREEVDVIFAELAKAE